MMKLGGYLHCTKISPEFECQDQRSKVKVTGDKKTKKCGIFFGSRPRGRFYAGGKISACYLVIAFSINNVLSRWRRNDIVIRPMSVPEAISFLSEGDATTSAANNRQPI